jgi:hypothetical protein
VTALLEKVEFNKKTDHVVFTGDLISKGPSSAEVVDLAQELGASSVRGNHEDRVLLAYKSIALSTPPPPSKDSPVDIAQYKRYQDMLEEAAISHGSKDVRDLARSLGPKRIAWLRECPVIWRIGAIKGMGEVVVVHAGLAVELGLEQQDPFLAMNMRSVDLGTRVPTETREGTPWYKV